MAMINYVKARAVNENNALKAIKIFLKANSEYISSDCSYIELISRSNYLKQLEQGFEPDPQVWGDIR